MSTHSIALLTSHDELVPVYTVRYHMHYNSAPTSVDFFDRDLAVGFARKIIALSLDNVAFHARNDGFYAHN